MNGTIAMTEARPRLVSRAAWLVKALTFGPLLALTAPTSIILLGWLQRRMRIVALRKAGLPAATPGWILGSRGDGRIVRWLGGLGANIREGLSAFVSLALATLPFTAIWVLAWWAGWENSFSKGYEQAFVGPMLAFFGIGLFMVLMIFIPLGLAHQAVEGRTLALFELRRVRSAYRETGWGYLALTVATVIMAMPVFAGRGLVTFAEGLYPALADMSASEASALAGRITLLKSLYVTAALIVLRNWAARIYSAAAVRAAHREPDLWQGSVMGALSVEAPRRWRGGRWLRTIMIALLWFGLAAQIFVAQFLNHAWWVWLTHPFLVLPMAI